MEPAKPLGPMGASSLLLLLLACTAAVVRSGNEPQLSELKVPAGFSLELWARVEGARSLAVSQNTSSPFHIVYVGTYLGSNQVRRRGCPDTRAQRGPAHTAQAADCTAAKQARPTSIGAWVCVCMCACARPRNQAPATPAAGAGGVGGQAGRWQAGGGTDTNPQRSQRSGLEGRGAVCGRNQQASCGLTLGPAAL